MIANSADNSVPRRPSSVGAEYLCLSKGFLAVLFVSLQLLDVNGVVAAVQLQEACKQRVGSLQLLQRPLILRQLVGIPSRPLSLEGVLRVFLHKESHVSTEHPSS